MFGCRAFVAGPEDLGYHGPDEEPVLPPRETGDWEIPSWEATGSARVRAQTRNSFVLEPESSRDEIRKSNLTKHSHLRGDAR